MQESIKRGILQVLKESVKAIKRQDLAKLRNQSDKTIHNVSIYQDHYSISISVVIYTILKILEKSSQKRTKEIEATEKVITSELKNARKALQKDKPYLFSKSLRKIILTLKQLDKETGLFMQKAIETSKVKKAYNLYSQGVSAGKAADLLGISKWDLQPYLGATRESEQKFNLSKSIEQRIKDVKEIFNVK